MCPEKTVTFVCNMEKINYHWSSLLTNLTNLDVVPSTPRCHLHKHAKNETTMKRWEVPSPMTPRVVVPWSSA